MRTEIIGHEVMLSFSRDPGRLERLAARICPEMSVGSPRHETTGSVA
jgi:hypothetical protein